MKLKHIFSYGFIIVFSAITFTGYYGFTVYNPETDSDRSIATEYQQPSNSKLSFRLLQQISLQNADGENLIWIYFKDKGADSDSRLSNPNLFLTEQSIERRLTRIKSNIIFDERDIPVNSAYINEVSASGIKIKNKSKWFNAVSCYANKIQIENLTQKDFIKSIEFVEKYKRLDDLDDIDNSQINYNNFPGNQTDNPDDISYGLSFIQSDIINVPLAHSSGYTGEGVIIANFDAGFDNLEHYCFNLMRSKGLRTYDFINGDTIVANGEGRIGEGSHGTRTLSLVGGYSPDSLVSPAYNSTFLLAKTENTESETPLEEDNWIAAAEWADSLGADVITSSLGYTNFDPPYPDYTWQTMNGSTARITIAADIAVSKGIVVVISSGNAFSHPTRNTLSAPADGFNVITVGAVNLNRVRANYSSVGPTVDGRIKPDVMAMGSNNYTAKPLPGSTGYINSVTGTSLSCPMVAGVCALILSANPNLSPVQVRDILRSTADNSSSPNNLVGWGIIDAWSAISSSIDINPNTASDFQLLQNYPNPFNPQTSFRFFLRKEAKVSLLVYDTRGRLVNTLINNINYSSGVKIFEYNFSDLSSGVYFYSLLADGNFIDSKSMVFVK